MFLDFGLLAFASHMSSRPRSRRSVHARAAARLAMGAALGAALGAVTVDAHGNAQTRDENLFADLPDSFVAPRAPSLHVAFLLQDGAGRCIKYAGRNRVTEMVDACAPAARRRAR